MAQLYHWTAVYEDGERLTEQEAKSFYDIDRSRLSRFELQGPTSVEVCMHTGRIYIGGHLFLVDKVKPYYSQDVDYELIQFKRARAYVGEKGHSILSYNVGWKFTKDDLHAQVVVTLQPGGDSFVELKETDLKTQKSNKCKFYTKVGEGNG